MEAAPSTERRYNTRFRGVPKSVFSYSRVGKKSASKPKLSSPVKTDLRDDFVYTKLGKKSSLNKQPVEQNVKNKDAKKVEPEDVLPSEEPEEEEEERERETSPNLPDPEVKPLSNGIHHDPPSEDDEEEGAPVEELVIKAEAQEVVDDLVIKTEAEEVDVGEDKEVVSIAGEEEMKSPFEKSITPKLQELVISGGSGSTKSVWITSKEKLSFNNCSVASYNPKSKMFRCIICQAVGFMSRIGEHYLGTHCNAKVFQCPQCSYCSAWWRCVRNHMSKSHGVSNAPASMWKNQPLLDEIMQLLQNLKYSVDCEDRVVRVAENSGKRYICPKCPYATDRRDLYNRHENIHREEKPFQCYICHKLFNRADHVKKHFCRIHKDYDYDINLIRRLPSKRSRLPVSPYNGVNSSPVHQLDNSFPPNSSSSTSLLAKPAISMPLGQSQLLNCLTGPLPVAKVNREAENLPVLNSSRDCTESEEPKENSLQKSHSNLLSYLTRTNFPSKPPLLEMPLSSGDPSSENYSGKRLQEGALAAFGFQHLANNVPKEFICPYCPWKSTDMWSLRMHTATHYNNACVLCNFRSTQESDLELHMWDCHRKRPCNKCNFLADSIIMLDAHIKEMHTTKPSMFRCRVCSQPFEIRSDMEAHSIFIHNQILRECKKDGCDFCSTDPDVLEVHRREKHAVSTTTEVSIASLPSPSSDNKSASRTQCLYCGCDFADAASLTLHEVIFHENPLQVAGQRQLDPYCCSVCGYSTPRQLMMMEHLRTHTGQELYCRAGDGCYFRTPYDTVLREHVLQSHCNDDGIVRCPHCGLRCSTRHSFVSHYQEHHHPFCCVLCEEVEHKYFVLTSSSSYLDSTIAALFPFAKKVADASRSVAKQESNWQMSIQRDMPKAPKDAIIVDTVRRSRKQLQPRKVLVTESEEMKEATPYFRSHWSKAKHPIRDVNRAHSNSFVCFYARKVRNLAQAPLLQCRLCVKRRQYFRQKRNFVFHILWHHRKRHQCNKCIQTFRHRYQVLLHIRREHKSKSLWTH